MTSRFPNDSATKFTMFSKTRLVLMYAVVTILLGLGHKSALAEGHNQTINGHIDSYLDALVTFDPQNSNTFQTSCKTLTAAVKSVLQYFDSKRWDQLTAPLYAFVKIREKEFPDVQYHRLYRIGNTVNRIDVLIKRSDGTLFALNRCPLEESISSLRKTELKNGTTTFFRGVKGPVTHKVIAGFDFQRPKKWEDGGQLVGFTVSYLLDTWDEKSRFEEKVKFTD